MGKKGKKQQSNKGVGNKKGKKQHGGTGTIRKSPKTADGEAYDEDWENWDDFLTGREFGLYRDYDEECDDGAGSTSRNTYDRTASPKLPKKGSVQALQAALENLWSNPNISNPQNVGIAMGPMSHWMLFAMYCSQYPESTSKVMQRYNEDKTIHKSTLEKLAREKDDAGFSGSIDYILALNCIFHDALDALDLDHPPALKLALGVRMLLTSGMSLHQSMMRIWQGYETRTLEIIRVVNENRLDQVHDFSETLPRNKIPIKVRGRYPWSNSRQYNPVFEQIQSLLSEFFSVEGINAYNPFHPTESNFCGSRFSEEEVEELLCQGVNPWDYDAELVLQALQNCDI